MLKMTKKLLSNFKKITINFIVCFYDEVGCLSEIEDKIIHNKNYLLYFKG